MSNKTINLQHIARVEGYGSLTVDMNKGILKGAKFQVLEGARFFEGILLGKKYYDVSIIVSRICAICSVSHSVVSTRAIENALGIITLQQTHELRELLVLSEFIQSHILHEYFLALPDYLRQPSAIALAQSHPELVKKGFHGKRIANEMQRKIGGRAVHPIRNVVGGFTMFPTENELQYFKNELPKIIEDTLSTIKILRNIPNQPSISPKGDYIAIFNPNHYAYYQADLLTYKGSKLTIEKAKYKELLIEEVRSYSHTKFSTLNDESFMVGALARLNINYKFLTDKGKEALEVSGLELPDINPYHINMAQLIEIVDCCQRSVNLIENFLINGFQREDLSQLNPKTGNGIALTEAPRGLLIHEYSFDNDLNCTYCNIITPTTFNQYKIETDCEDLIHRYHKEPKESMELKLNMLVRAYDPCISCSAHALSLKINYEE
ncbi:MAG: Sulfhydrogenase 2 subunit alpha [Candidatus Heimdallarchaeota archaeon LC_3]|nr:MAG: Sulfhydrogenase 2 subunit alpha [Candidatus Heimdallarchaeota archaeon LC_3]